MPLAFVILICAQWLGEVLRRVLHLPLPGPVIGMFLLALALATRARGWLGVPVGTAPLVRTAEALIGNMGLLFVPAGVGIITETDVLRRAWFPIVAGLLISTVLGLVVTAWVMHRVSRRAESRALPGGRRTT